MRVHDRVVLALAAILALVAPSNGVAATITGRIILTPRAAPQQAAVNPYPGMLGTMGACCTAKSAPVDDVGNVVVSIPSLVATRPAASSVRPQMQQVQQSFQPRVLAVQTGTTVDFPNHDPIFHNAFSYSKAKRFDLGKYGQGKSASVTFDKPGVVQIFCDIHSNMSAWIYVVTTAHVTQPDASGDFVLRNVPPGVHSIEIWHPERGTQRHEVTVKDSGAHVDLTF